MMDISSQDIKNTTNIEDLTKTVKNKKEMLEKIRKAKKNLHQKTGGLSNVNNIKKLTTIYEKPKKQFISIRKKRIKVKNNFKNFKKLVSFFSKKKQNTDFIKKMCTLCKNSFLIKMLLVCISDKNNIESAENYYNTKKNDPQRQQIKQMIDQKYTLLYEEDDPVYKKKFKISFPLKLIYDNKITIDLETINKNNITKII